MLLNDLLNGANVIRWKKRGKSVTKEVTTGPDLRARRQFVQVSDPEENNA